MAHIELEEVWVFLRTIWIISVLLGLFIAVPNAVVENTFWGAMKRSEVLIGLSMIFTGFIALPLFALIILVSACVSIYKQTQIKLKNDDLDPNYLKPTEHRVDQ